MAPGTSSRRQSLDFIRNTTTASDTSVKPLLRPGEECTRSYVVRVRSGFCGRWVCGLCSEAVAEELRRHVVKEEALRAHMEVCRRFSKVAANPAVALVGAMVEILRRESNKNL
uniref:Uncharacterized protein n=1 Tax=Ananas comosus var. bracteatus TaxID=296719 RepID=A0A6V7P4Y0_ANACO|nr:unnamed protein product [Ananas comosus var. bracteatus]